MKRSSTRPKFEITVDTRNTVNHAGSAGLVELADKIGLTKGWSQTMAKPRSRRPIHNPGRVLRDLVVMLADGGDCLTDLSAMRDQPDLFGQVASTPTAYRVIDSIGPPQLEGVAGGPSAGSGPGLEDGCGCHRDRARLRCFADHRALGEGGAGRQLQGRLRLPSTVLLLGPKRRGTGRTASPGQRDPAPSGP